MVLRSSSISFRTIRPMSIPWFQGEVAPRSSIRDGTGMCGETRNRTVRRQTTGRASLAARPGVSLDEASGQYYYHAYLKQQPDLNYNPDVKRAMCEVLKFWFDRGVDGFRVDAIHHLHERDEEDRDNPLRTRAGAREWSLKRRWLQIRTIDQPGVHASIRAMRQVADAYADRVMIGEAYLPIDQLMAYYGGGPDRLPLASSTSTSISTAWNPQAIASLIEAYEAALPIGGWPNWVLGNHDSSRVASRVGRAQARVAAMLLLTLRGTPDNLPGRGAWDGGYSYSAAPRAGPS